MFKAALTPTALAQAGTPALVATSGVINLKNTGETALFTVPAGKVFVETGLLLALTEVSALTVLPTVRAGKTPNFNEIVGATAVTGLAAPADFVDLRAFTALQKSSAFSAGDVISFSVTVGATATTLRGQVYLLGFFLSV